MAALLIEELGVQAGSPAPRASLSPFWKPITPKAGPFSTPINLLGFVSQRGYALFGWWRIAVGSLVLLELAV